MTTPDPLQADFRNFLFLIWKHLGLPDPTPIQYDIAYRLQHGPVRDCIQAFRGCGKSYITVAYVLWRFYCDPELKVMVVSASRALADNWATFALQLIEDVDFLHHLRPRDDQRASKIQFDVGPASPAKDPSLRSIGITGQMTGGRADIIIPDDIEVPSNSMTQHQRDRLGELIKEFDAILKPGGSVKFLGTPQCDQSVYNLLPDRGYGVCMWPARYPTLKSASMYSDKLAEIISSALEANPKIAGNPTDPGRFNALDLAEREASYGRSGFSLQYMLDTTLSDADRYPLRLSDLIISDIDPDVGPEKIVHKSDPEAVINDVPCVGLNGDRYYRGYVPQGVQYVPYHDSVLAIDPSGRGKDELGYAVVKSLNSQLFVPTCGGFKGGYDEVTLRKLALLAKEHKVNRIIVEANFGDGMWTKLFEPILRSIHSCTIEEVKHYGMSKELRIIDTLEPVLNQHRLIIPRRLIEADFKSTEGHATETARYYQLFFQMTRITKDRGALVHDDRLEALAMGVAYFVKRMNRNAEEMMELRRMELLEQELRDLYDEPLDSDTAFSNAAWNR